jgi:hypothetical protein
MNKDMKRLFSCLLVALCAFSFSSCKHPEPEPEPEPTPKTPVNLSLGETAKVTAASFFGAEISSKLTRGEDDTYSLVFTGDGLEIVADPLSDYDATKMFSRYLNTPLTTSFTLSNKVTAPGSDNDIDLSALLPNQLNGGSISKSYTLNFGNFPASLTELEGVGLTEDSSFDVTVSVAKPCFTAGKLIPKFTVDLASLFGVREANDKGLLVFDMELSAENGWTATKTFHPESFTVKSENYNATGKSVRADLFAAGGVVAVHEGLKTTRSRLASAPAAMIKLSVAVVLKKVNVGSFTGKFNRGVKDGSTSVDMPLLTSSLESLGLDPSATKMAMDVESQFPFETGALLDITAKKSRASFGSITGIPVVIPASSGEGSAKAHYDLSKAEDLAPLLTKVASEMSFTAGVDAKNTTCTFRVGEPAKATMVPTVTVPMCFGSGLNYAAEERLDLPQNASAALKGGTLTMSGKMTNTFPVALTAAVVVVDASGNAVTEEVSASFPSERESDIQLSFKPKAGASLENAKAVVIKYKVKGIDGSRPLKATDYIQAKLDAKITYAN